MAASPGRVLAVLGPTNTGKTHFALERMLGHASGMIGFPLRLLARENYERVVRAKGAAQVALITGEEKIVPAHPRYFVCTVESMPLDRRVAFLAVDEIQLAADPERGHIFTERLLAARGEVETQFLGAETIRPLLRRLVSGLDFVTRPRFSRLSYDGPRKLGRLPPRSAVVAFSAAEVYAMAEFIRRQRGGAAVVLGALSPRTRNAQIGLYQAGEVDTIVATDAIGMGLNMDIDHVAFAALRKFDGRGPRDLTASEVAQIAGRAGRHMNDGSFGTTGDCGGIAPEVVEAVENHHFPPLKTLMWRNGELRFASVAALLSCLERAPDRAGLVRAREADDHLALAALAREDDILALASHPERVRLLWEVCRIPDFRKVMAESHARLLGQIYRHLAGPAERLPTDWLAAQINRLDRVDGDLDTLIARIAHVRTWTYVSHRGDWVEDSAHWQGLTRAIEDRLSDALHQRLTQRFVDRRTAVLMRRMKDATPIVGDIASSGRVMVEGQPIGRLAGFRFEPDAADGANAAKAVLAAAGRALKGEVAARIAQLADDPADAIALGPDGMIRWRGEPVAQLASGAEPLAPMVEPLASDLLEPALRDRLRRHLAGWLADRIATGLAPLVAAKRSALTGAARGLVHQLGEALGSLPRAGADAQVAALNDEERRLLARLGIRFGLESVFLPALLKPQPQKLRALLWSVHHRRPALPPPGERGSVAAELPADFYQAVGYRVVGHRAIRVDLLERLAAEARCLAREAGKAGFIPSPLMTSLIGASADQLTPVLEGLGFSRRGEAAETRFHPRPRVRPQRRPLPAPDSPFAVLRKKP